MLAAKFASVSSGKALRLTSACMDIVCKHVVSSIPSRSLPLFVREVVYDRGHVLLVCNYVDVCSLVFYVKFILVLRPHVSLYAPKSYTLLNSFEFYRSCCFPGSPANYS